MVLLRPHPTKFGKPDPLDGIAQVRAAKLLGVIFTVNWALRIMLTLCWLMLSACLFVKIIAKLGLSNTAVAMYTVFCLNIVSDYLCTPSLRRTAYQTAAKNVWMLFLNGLESLVFATNIIPQPNYVTKQMLGFLGLY